MEDPRENEPTVVVRRQWNDYRKATYRLADISDLHWDRYSGGVFAYAPQPFIHGYVQCDAMLSGELAHSGTHGSCPHRIKVCLTKIDNKPVWDQVLSLAGPRPRSRQR